MGARRYPIRAGAGIIGERALRAPHAGGRHEGAATREIVSPA